MGGPWHIVHLCRTGWPVVGGMEVAVHGLARAQAERGHRVEVVTLLHARDGRGLPDVDHEGVRYRRIHRLGPWRYPFAWGGLRAVQGADLVHVHGLDGLADRVVRARHRPPVGISTHGGYFHSDRHRALKEAVLRTVTRRTLALADRVWFTSAVDRDLFDGPGVRGEIVGNGVAMDDLLQSQRDPEPGLWVSVGRLDLHKGQERLLDVLARVPGARLELVAPPDDRRGELERRAAELGVGHRLHFRGELDRAGLREALCRAELVLFPSRHESFGIAVVEAMAAGSPVVVSDIAAHRALVEHERTGWVVDFGDPDGVASVVRSIAGRGETAGAAAREVASVHGWHRRIAHWSRAYAELLERPRLEIEA